MSPDPRVPMAPKTEAPDYESEFQNMMAIVRGQMSNHPHDYARGWLRSHQAHQARVKEIKEAAELPWREALLSVAWNENDGKCWCRESPDDGPGKVKPHEPRCMEARALLGERERGGV